MALEVNKNLSWRDIQHLVVHNSDKINPTSPSWLQNGAGLMVSDYFGFGALNAGRLVEAARHPKWMTSRQLHVCSSDTFGLNQKIESLSAVVIKHNTTSCSSQSNCVTKLEHVRLYVTLESYPRGGIEIELISPSGTKSPILKKRRKDAYASAFSDWGFMALTFWDEDPRGEWTVRIEQTTSRTRDGKLSSLRMEWYGTCGTTDSTTDSPTIITTTSTTKSGGEIPTTSIKLSTFYIALIVLASVLITVLLCALLYKIYMYFRHSRQQRRQISTTTFASTNSQQNNGIVAVQITNQNHVNQNNNRLMRFSETSYDLNNPAYDSQFEGGATNQPPPYNP